jgi:hypothetical protein
MVVQSRAAMQRPHRKMKAAMAAAFGVLRMIPD